jgi:putative tricarboxylic transport membrane protein
MMVFGVLGYVLRKLDFPLAPTVLALILGPFMEKSLRTSLEMSGGDFGIFVTRPLSLALLGLAAAVLATSALRLAPLRAVREAESA